MAKWFCKVKGTELGPYSKSELKLMVEKGKLRPRDLVRAETESGWTKASEMTGWFTDEEIAEDEADADRQRARKQKRRREESEAGDGYFAALGVELRYGGEWLGVLLKAAVINGILFGLTTLWIASKVNVQNTSAIAAMAAAAVGSALLMAIGLLVEAALLGLPMLAVKKDWSSAHILDAYALTQFYGCLISFFTAAVLVTNRPAGVVFLLLLPVFQSGLFAYLACTRWEMPIWITGLLGVLRLLTWVPLFLVAVFMMAALLGLSLARG